MRIYTKTTKVIGVTPEEFDKMAKLVRQIIEGVPDSHTIDLSDTEALAIDVDSRHANAGPRVPRERERPPQES